jgi:gamma-glutamylcyclotransferase (GGCT)/AIG2-like uncharacterized protein YtfP
MTKQNGLYVFAYGSLRKGEYHFQRIASEYGSESIVWLGTSELKGFVMYDLGYYPTICPSPDLLEVSMDGSMKKREPKIVVDILSVSPEAYGDIYLMESQAGYKLGTAKIPILKLGSADKKDLGVYYYMDSPCPVVTNGDWVDYEHKVYEPRSVEDETAKTI